MHQLIFADIDAGMEQLAQGLALPAFDRSMAVLHAAALLGGLVRGFTRFGFAMIFMPIAGLVLPLPAASALIWAIDAPFALPMAARSLRKAQWREILPLLAGAALLLPAGVWLLTSLPQLTMRWLLAALIIAAVAAMATGWRWKGKAGMPLSLGVGGLSGLASGLAQLGGMPLAIFWLSAQHKSADQMRHDMVSYFACATVLSGIVLWWSGILTVGALAMAAPLLVPYGLGIFVGSRCYHLASERTFRRVAYGVIMVAALVSLPLWDGALKRS